MIVNGQILPISRTGKNKFVSNFTHKTIHLNNILHVLSVTKNLLSVSQSTKDNHVFLNFAPLIVVLSIIMMFGLLLCNQSMGMLTMYTSLMNIVSIFK